MVKSFAFYPGCALKGSAREYELSLRRLCGELGIEVKELEDWVCCGASSAHTIDAGLATALPAVELDKAAATGLPLLVACPLCFFRLRFAAQERKSPPIWHLLQVLEEAEIPVRKPLNGLRVACYYGCLLVRPPVTRLDDPENPTLMDRLVARLGAEVVEWAFKTECCGAGLALPLPDTVLHLSHRILYQAREAKAEMVVVACPMCHFNLDSYQRYGNGPSLPILYISQLVGLALGFSPRELGLARHLVNPIPLLRKKGVV